ncbi:MAG TPA: DHHA1 domain-containing protein, partial [Gammaproteobacteria bacterium]
ESLTAKGRVVALFDADGAPATSLGAEQSGTVVLDRTPFYAESGGQVGDTGTLSREGLRFDVADTIKLGSAFGHVGRVSTGTLEVGAQVTAAVDAERRAAIVLNHSATHLLHAALRRTLGDHVQQKGSLVAPDRLRFDFSHYEALDAGELTAVEALVNDEIRRNSAANIRVLPYDKAIAAGALAFFGDKYGDRVRVLELGEFSTELCGGTHVKRAGDIGLFKITAETGIAAGVRRIEAVTGRGALEWVRCGEQALKNVAALLKGGRDDVSSKVAQLVERTRELEREIQNLKTKLATGSSRDLLQEAREINGIKVLVARLDGTDAKALQEAADRCKDRLGSGVVVLGGVDDDKVRLVAGVTKDLTGTFKAGQLIQLVAKRVGGSGGGRPDFAQGGGTLPDKLDEALALIEPAIAAASAA